MSGRRAAMPPGTAGPPAGSLPLTIGTAGHIDHGKTALVQAMTGIDTDRLPEEKARGITIALGFAPLQLPNGRVLSLVDVPGHQRLIRTMVSGATGIDLFLLVVAADDGVMPQTLEHVRVLEALDIHRGVVAVTKSDLADPTAGSQRRSNAAARCRDHPVLGPYRHGRDRRPRRPGSDRRGRAGAPRPPVRRCSTSIACSRSPARAPPAAAGPSRHP